MAKKKSKKSVKEKAPKEKPGGVDLATEIVQKLRVTQGFQLASFDASSTPGFKGDKAAAEELLAAGVDELDTLQERLYAGGRDGEGPSILLVVQGMDTSGKGGIMRHVVGSVDPQGVQLTSFKAPNAEERKHPFLWRIRKALPKPGYIGVFDRSHYEDVLIVRVHNLVPASTWQRRYGQINTFEKSVSGNDTHIIKIMLHISADEQKARLRERLDRPDKWWKFNPGDLDEREHWPAYQEAYQAVLDKTSTDTAPWYVVPADRKWFARLAVQQILLHHLRALDLQWPAAEFDVEEQKQRLAESW
ncbi:polyphosphate kinase 2 family protein [Yimella sp. cx-573]|nr:polyphosphate kinase 2 family protein [Yimella sp. cx-573]